MNKRHIKEVAHLTNFTEEDVSKIIKTYMMCIMKDLTSNINVTMKPLFSIHTKLVDSNAEIFIPGTKEKVKRKKKIKLYLKPTRGLKRQLERE